MKAVVMAGGEGVRLRPLTSNQPKPMITVANRPVVEYILELFKRYNFKDVVMTLHFLPETIRRYFGSGEEIDVNISYVREEVPLGTAGSVKNAEEHLKETFLVISGDALTDFDLQEIVAFHRRKKAVVTIALKKVDNPLEYGIVITNSFGKIERFLEKPGWGEVFSDTVNTGIYVLEPEIFQYIPENQPFDFSKDLFPLLLKEGKPLYGFVSEGYWCDIGNLKQYKQANLDILEGRVNFQPKAIKTEQDVWIGKGAVIHPEAVVKGPSILGQHVRIERGAKIGELSILGPNVVVKEGAHVHRAVVMDNAFIGSHAVLHDCILGRNCEARKGARIEERAVIGDESIIGEDAIINHDVKVYPFKTIEAGAVVNRSIIWEPRGTRALFGKEGLSGLLNVDINAEVALRVAMAFGSLLPQDSTVVCSRDASRGARMIKTAVAAGLVATGVNVRDIKVAAAPLNRFAIRATNSVGGVHVRLAPFNPQVIQIQLFDSEGIDVSSATQRKIEQYFFREDFRRAFFSEIGQHQYHAQMMEYYIDALCRSIELCEMERVKRRVVIDHAFGTSSLIFPYFLEKVGLEAISLNAHTSESYAAVSLETLERSLIELGKTVKMFQADFGILFDNAAEKIVLVDDKGRRVSYETLLLLLVYLVSRFEKRKGKIAVPLGVSSWVEEIAKRFKRRVVRVRMSPQALMKIAKRGDIVFAGAYGGGFIFSRFLPAYDGIMSFAKLIAYLNAAGTSLSAIVDQLPTPHLVQKAVFCPWEKKGQIIRVLTERHGNKEAQFLEGIKVSFGKRRWFLVIPDAEEPLVKIFAEGESGKEARQRASEVASEIEEIIEVG